jgi:hypothetical protein
MTKIFTQLPAGAVSELINDIRADRFSSWADLV